MTDKIERSATAVPAGTAVPRPLFAAVQLLFLPLFHRCYSITAKRPSSPWKSSGNWGGFSNITAVKFFSAH